MIKLMLILFGWVWVSCSGDSAETPVKEETPGSKVLVFSKTKGYRHASIRDGVRLIRSLGEAHDFEVKSTENAGVFTSDELKDYDLVIFLSTTGDVLNEQQQQAFEAYIRNGGNFMGIHSASDTEYDWPWYGGLVGAYFDSHPSVQTAELKVEDNGHPATAHLQSTWTRRDEWYNFKDFDSGINVLITLDENSYEGGTNGAFHPWSWYRTYDGGRSFYTAGGHTPESYSEPDFVAHLLGGIMYCLGRN